MEPSKGARHFHKLFQKEFSFIHSLESLKIFNPRQAMFQSPCLMFSLPTDTKTINSCQVWTLPIACFRFHRSMVHRCSPAHQAGITSWSQDSSKSIPMHGLGHVHPRYTARPAAFIGYLTGSVAWFQFCSFSSLSLVTIHLLFPPSHWRWQNATKNFQV